MAMFKKSGWQKWSYTKSGESVYSSCVEDKTTASDMHGDLIKSGYVKGHYETKHKHFEQTW